MAKVVVLCAYPWSLTDEKTGEIKEGTSVQWLYKYHNPTFSEDLVGCKPYKCTLPRDRFNDFNKGCGLYDAELDIVPGAGGKPTVVLGKVNFLNALKDLIPA